MRKALPLLFATLTAAGVALLPPRFAFSGQSPADATYVGHENCKMCHSDQHKKWLTSKHARAFELLAATDKAADPECLPCHSTGFGKEGGFAPGATDPDLRGVQCEACHGPGSKHNGNKEKITRTPPATVCTKCHLDTAIH